MINDSNGWRLQDQRSYLANAVFVKKIYKSPGKSWDHDHCEFCWSKFAEGDDPEILHDGYCTEDEYHWICQQCFEDFKYSFGWVLKK